MIQLPAILKPISRRADKSVMLKLDTRELTPEETLTLMAIEGAEMWVCLAPNKEDIEIPEERAEVEEKTPSERLRNVLFVWYKQLTGKGEYLGTFDNFKREKYEKIIEQIKSKLV